SGRQRLAAARETRGSRAEHKNSPVTSGARFSLSGTGYPNGHNVTASGIWVVTFVLKAHRPDIQKPWIRASAVERPAALMGACLCDSLNWFRASLLFLPARIAGKRPSHSPEDVAGCHTSGSHSDSHFGSSLASFFDALEAAYLI